MPTRQHRRTTHRFWIFLLILSIAFAASWALVFRPSASGPRPPRVANRPSAPVFGLNPWKVSPVRLHEPMMGLAAVSTPSALWVLGGLVQDQSTTLIQKVTWTKSGLPQSLQVVSPGLPVPVHDAAAVALNGHIVLLGGGTYTSSAAVYSLPVPAMAPASSLGSLPEPLSDLAAQVDGGRILVVGGHNAGVPSNVIWSYAPGHASRVWADLPAGVRYAAAAASAHTLYVVGGLTATGVTNQAIAFNLKTRKMTMLPPYPVALQYAEAIVIDHTLVVAGGQTAAGWTRAVYWYQSASRTWRQAPDLPSPAGYGALVPTPSGGAAWVGGQGPSGALDTIWTISMR